MVITDITKLFKVYISRFTDSDYIVIAFAKKIMLNGNETVDLNLLEQAFKFPDSQRSIDGTLEECSFTHATDDINMKLGYKLGVVDLEVCDQKEHIKRKQLFWDIVASQISLPPEKTYEHVAFHGSLLSFGVYWNCCYIFVNGNEAFAIAMGASD